MRRTSYRIFDVTLAGRQMLSPHMARLTFGGDEVADMAMHAPDQRIKLFFPKADGSPPAIPDRPDWYDLYRSVPPAERAPMRTYTIRALDAGALTVDFVLHGDEGPASRWAAAAAPGERIQISAPCRHSDASPGGYDWEPPAGVERVLVIADETALPAVAGIFEQLAAMPRRPAVQAFIEVPGEADRLELPVWDGLELHWMPRRRTDGTSVPYGAGMVEAALRATIPPGMLGTDRGALATVDIDRDTLWDRARPGDSAFYAWVAGETAAVSRIRTLFIRDKAIDRRCLTLMGYWRHGKAKP